MSKSIKKEHLDSFIEEEAAKVMFELLGDEEFTSSERDRLERSIDRAEDEIENSEEKVRILKQKSVEHKRAMANRINPIEKEIERLQARKFDEEAKEAEEELKQDRERLDNLFNDKREAEAEAREAEAQARAADSGEATPGAGGLSESLLELYEEYSSSLQEDLTQQPAPAAPVPQKIVPQQTAPTPQPKKKAIVVNFDKSGKEPFTVKFSERGFLIGDTRLSFEVIENALSKGYTLTLGSGFVLDGVKMQKILKYKDKI